MRRGFDLFCVREKPLKRCRCVDSLARPFEQSNAERGLKRLKAASDGCRIDAQPPRGAL